MNPSALIFIALAVAWAAYLVPQALKHRNDVHRQRSVERFSHRMRVLARREPTSSRDARLVVTPGRAPSRPVVEVKGAAKAASAEVTAAARVQRPLSPAARREAANRAARRRRNVLGVIASLLVIVGGLGFGGVFSPWWIAAPTAVLVAWLVACRLMVTRERALAPVATSKVEDETEVAMAPVPVEVDPETGEIVAVDDDPSRWDMIPVTLPTYVSKPAAERSSVSTIDLESTGVWTSGRTDGDAEIARQAEARRKSAQRIAEARQQQRAVGS